MTIKTTLVGLALAFLFVVGSDAQQEFGTVCVASRAATPFRGQIIPPTGEVSSGGLQVKIDKRPAVPWPQRKSLKIDGLDTKERHLLVVVDANGKPEQSLWFRFSSYKSIRLCMSYDRYGGIDLQEDARCPWSKCR
ncbi:MAG: hypothetical protein WBE13_02090 [Candidatus Acidiferrum sp.]